IRPSPRRKKLVSGMVGRHARQNEPRHQRITQKGEQQQEQPCQLHPVVRRAYTAARANRLLRQNLQTAMLAVHRALFSCQEKTLLPNARSLHLCLVENYWSEEQSRDSSGETCLGRTFVALGVNSKWRSH